MAKNKIKKMQPKLLVFVIKAQKEVPIPFTNDPKKYPIHEHYLSEVEEKTFIYKYKPDSSLDEEKYISFLKEKFKRKYNALSVECGSLENLLGITENKA